MVTNVSCCTCCTCASVATCNLQLSTLFDLVGLFALKAWTKSSRWSHHSDMVKQYALCAHHRLTTQFNISEPSIYIDSWISLNGRFAQRVYDPRVNIVKAEWSAFKKPDWVLPVLSHLTQWRERMKSLEEGVSQENSANSVIFIADFPGIL